MACDKVGGAPTELDEPRVTEIAVDPDTATLLTVGETLPLNATALDQSGAPLPGTSFVWSSSDTSVATVTSDGTVTARGNGAVAIEAEASGVGGRATVVVRAGELDWLRIRAGLINSCGLTTHGTAYCWGENVHGQLGNGEQAQFSPWPARVNAELLYFEEITIGGGHVCARTHQGAAYCWGNSAFGEGGYGEFTGVQLDLMEVSGGHDFQQVRAGGNHTCGLTTDGTAYCWGRNGEGQLGDGTIEDRSTPVEVEGGLTFSHISVGKEAVGNHTCALTPGGSAYCWGANHQGQLGAGPTEHRNTPVPVDTDQTFEQLALGANHTCGLTPEGDLYCWGGTPTDTSVAVPVPPTLIGGGQRFDAISAGGTRTCGLTSEGAVYCWGTGAFAAPEEDRTVPTETVAGIDFAQFERGVEHHCGVSGAGVGYCWGDNTFGQVGDGTREPRPQPTALPQPSEID